MDCLEVQQLLSQAVDRDPVNAQKLAEAREHCGVCPSCMAFVRGLALTHRAEPPQEPEGLADRVVAAVREEATRLESAAGPAEDVEAEVSGERLASQALEPPETLATPSALAGTMAARGSAQAHKHKRRMTPVTMGAWIGAAAAVLILATFAAVAGVRSIVNGPSRASLSENQAENGFTTTPPVTDDSKSSGSGTSQPEAATADVARELPAPNMISAQGFAYQLIGTTAVDPSTLTPYATTATSLDSEGTPQNYTVYKTPTGGRVALIRGEELLLFDIVRRTYNQRLYALTSGALSSFAAWPSLPSSIPEPTTPEGAPTFVSAGLDDTGLEVYRLPTVDASQGIAVPPDAPVSDPGAGNPHWTWWSAPPQ